MDGAADARLIARSETLSEIRSRLADGGMVTVCGPGGIGKTTLAMELASSWGRDARVCLRGPPPTACSAARGLWLRGCGLRT